MQQTNYNLISPQFEVELLAYQLNLISPKFEVELLAHQFPINLKEQSFELEDAENKAADEMISLRNARTNIANAVENANSNEDSEWLEFDDKPNIAVGNTKLFIRNYTIFLFLRKTQLSMFPHNFCVFLSHRCQSKRWRMWTSKTQMRTNGPVSSRRAHGTPAMRWKRIFDFLESFHIVF